MGRIRSTMSSLAQNWTMTRKSYPALPFEVGGLFLGVFLLVAIPIGLLLNWVTAILLAIPAGMLAALKRYSFFDQFVTFFAYVGNSMPTFWLGLMLIMLFAEKIRIFPPTAPQGNLGQILAHPAGLVLPVGKFSMPVILFSMPKINMPL